MEYIKFFFQDIWHFLGLLLILQVLTKSVTTVLGIWWRAIDKTLGQIMNFFSKK